jgi:hypothetical protein
MKQVWMTDEIGEHITLLKREQAFVRANMPHASCVDRKRIVKKPVGLVTVLRC